MKKTRIIFLGLIVILFLFLRLYHLEQFLTIGTDQGMPLLEMYRIFHSKKLTLLGPVSSFKVYGRQFFFGPATYYLSLPVFALSGWNIFSVSYFVIFVQLFAFLILYKTLQSHFPKSNVPLYYALIFAFAPTMVNYARFLWNPNLMIPTSVLLLAVLLALKRKIKREFFWIGFAGFLLGLGMQFHYSYFLMIVFTLAWLYIGKKINLVNLFSLLVGFVVGFLPIILFELRHNFYNLTTFTQFVLVSLKGSTNFNLYAPGYIPEYYSLSFLPFLYLAVSLLLVKLERVSCFLPFFLILGYITFSLVKILPVPSEGFLSPPGWNYPGVKKAKEIIISENKKNYNIVDLLTGDTRAIYLRALLTLDRKPPMTVDEYPDSKFLFIYSKVPIEDLLKGSLWEMDVMRPLKVQKTWHLQNGIYLYLLERVEKK